MDDDDDVAGGHVPEAVQQEMYDQAMALIEEGRASTARMTANQETEAASAGAASAAAPPVDRPRLRPGADSRAPVTPSRSGSPSAGTEYAQQGLAARGVADLHARGYEHAATHIPEEHGRAPTPPWRKRGRSGPPVRTPAPSHPVRPAAKARPSSSRPTSGPPSNTSPWSRPSAPPVAGSHRGPGSVVPSACRPTPRKLPPFDPPPPPIRQRMAQKE